MTDDPIEFKPRKKQKPDVNVIGQMLDYVKPAIDQLRADNKELSDRLAKAIEALKMAPDCACGGIRRAWTVEHSKECERYRALRAEALGDKP